MKAMDLNAAGSLLVAEIRPDPVAAAPLMCAGMIGWRSAGGARRIGLYGFGAAALVP